MTVAVVVAVYASVVVNASDVTYLFWFAFLLNLTRLLGLTCLMWLWLT